MPNPNISNNGQILTGGFGVASPGAGGVGAGPGTYAPSDGLYMLWSADARLTAATVFPSVILANNTGIPPDIRFLWFDEAATPPILKYYDNVAAVWAAVAKPDGSLPPVKVVATVNLTLSGAQTIDIVACVAGDIVLATAQTTASQNGPWVVQSGGSPAWVRPSWYASGSIIGIGSYLWAALGTANGQAAWFLTNSAPITVDTGASSWQKVAYGSGSGTVTSVAMSVPSWLNVTGTITTSGTFVVTPDGTQVSNLALLSPDGITGAVSLRRIQFTDLPNPPVKAVADSNIAVLSGTTTIDTQALNAGDLVLLTAQTTGSQSGPWVIQTGAWTRPAWYAAAATIQPGMTLWVFGGTSYVNTLWYLSGVTPVTVNTTASVWIKSATSVSKATISVSGTVKTTATHADPVVYERTETDTLLAGKVGTGDSRLSDARTPLAHAASHGDGGTDEISIDADMVTTGTFVIARVATGAPTGSLFVRDDSTLAVPWTPQTMVAPNAVQLAVNTALTPNLIIAAPGYGSSIQANAVRHEWQYATTASPISTDFKGPAGTNATTDYFTSEALVSGQNGVPTLAAGTNLTFRVRSRADYQQGATAPTPSGWVTSATTAYTVPRKATFILPIIGTLATGLQKATIIVPPGFNGMLTNLQLYLSSAGSTQSQVQLQVSSHTGSFSATSTSQTITAAATTNYGDDGGTISTPISVTPGQILGCNVVTAGTGAADGELQATFTY